MDSFEDIEGEEEVDYDFNLDDDFLNEGLDDEDDEFGTAEGKGAGAATTGKAVPETKKPSAGATEAEDSGKNVKATPTNPPMATAVSEAKASQASSRLEGPERKEGARKRIPIPVPKPHDAARVGEEGKGSQGRQRVPIPTPKPSTSNAQPNGSTTDQSGRARLSAKAPEWNMQRPLPAERQEDVSIRNRGAPSRQIQGEGGLQGSGRGARMQQPGKRLLNPRMGSDVRPHTMLPNGVQQFRQTLPSGPHSVPVLPMPPGLPMPDMGMPMPFVNRMGLRPRSDGWPHTRDSPQGAGMRNEPGGPGPLIAQHFAHRNPSVNKFPGHPGGRSGDGMHGNLGGRLGGPLGGGRPEEERREAKKRVWDRLGSEPQLAGDFDADDDFEPAKKRTPPERKVSTGRVLGGRIQPALESGLRLPPPLHSSLQGRRGQGGGASTSAAAPAKDPVAEAAERAKKEAEAQRLAEIQKQIEAQKLENALLAKMKELKKKEQIAALQEQIATLEAAAKARQAAAAKRAAALKPAEPVSKPGVSKALEPQSNPGVSKAPPAAAPTTAASPTELPSAAPATQPQRTNKASTVATQAPRKRASPEGVDEAIVERKRAAKLRSTIKQVVRQEDVLPAKRQGVPAAASLREREEDDDWHYPQQWEHPGVGTGDLRDFLSRQRAKRQGGVRAESGLQLRSKR